MRYTAFLLLFSVASCGDPTPPSPALVISPIAAELARGDTLRIAAIDGLGTERWRSDQPTIASVDTRGLVTAIAAGRAYVWAHRGADSASATIEVIGGICVLPATMTPASAMLVIGERRSAAARVSGCGLGSNQAKWTSADPTIAEVEPGGVVDGSSTAIVAGRGAGQVVITAAAVDDPSVTVTMAVTVRLP